MAGGPLGCFGPGSTVDVEGTRIVETGPAGDRAVWGTLREEVPGEVLSMTWHPGREESSATLVTVTFVPVSDGGSTLVTLVHEGWERYDDPEAARREYSGGWPTVLGLFAEGPTPAAEVPEPVWLVLEHRPEPATPAEGVSTSPLFAQHVRFLSGLAEQGVLVAAGPLPDADGEGMAVVRAPDAGAAREVVRQAQDEDGSVTGELLSVRVRPWAVVISGR